MNRRFWFSRNENNCDKVDNIQKPKMHPEINMDQEIRNKVINNIPDSAQENPSHPKSDNENKELKSVNFQSNNNTDPKYFRNKNIPFDKSVKMAHTYQVPERFRRSKQISNHTDVNAHKHQYDNQNPDHKIVNNNNSNNNNNLINNNNQNLNGNSTSCNGQPFRPNINYCRQWAPYCNIMSNGDCCAYSETESPGVMCPVPYEHDQNKSEIDLQYANMPFFMSGNENPPGVQPWIPIQCNEFPPYFSNESNNGVVVHHYVGNTPNILRPGGPPLPFRNIDITARFSTEKDFSDLPMQNMENLRFFYNLGVKYFRLGSLVCPPLHFAQSQTNSQFNGQENRSQERQPRRTRRNHRNNHEENCSELKNCPDCYQRMEPNVETQYDSTIHNFSPVNGLNCYSAPPDDEIPNYEEMYM